MTRRACVLGAGGILGTALCDALLAERWDVTAVTAERRCPVVGVRGAVAPALSSQRAILEQHTWDLVVDLRAYDVSDLDGLASIAARTADTWVHISSVYAQRRLSTLQSARDGAAPAVLDPDHPALPSGVYGEGKLRCELHWARSDAAAVSLRLPFVVGPRDRSGRVRRYVDLLSSGRPLAIPDRGRHRVPLLFAGDAASYVVALADAGVPGGTVQLAGPSLPLATHVAGIAAALGRELVIEEASGPREPPPFSYPVDLLADPSAAMSLVPRWAPTPWQTAWNLTVPAI